MSLRSALGSRLASAWSACVVAMARLWEKGTAGRAAGVAAVVLGFQALRWLLRAAAARGDGSPSPLRSPQKDAKDTAAELSPLTSGAADGQASSSGGSSPEQSPERGEAEGLPPSECSAGSHHSRARSKQGGEPGPAPPAADRVDGTVLTGPALAFPEVDYEPQRSPFDLSTSRPAAAQNGHAGEKKAAGDRRHVRFPAEPGGEPQGSGGSDGGAQPEMGPAPTEAGDAVAAAEADSRLQGLEQAPVRRHSRSFSEPNLAGRLAAQQAASAAAGGAPPPRESSEDGSEADDGFGAKGRRAGGGLQGAGGSTGAKRSRLEQQPPPPPPLLRLDVLSGPASGRDLTLDDASRQVWVGRAGECGLSIEDNEVSGRHALLLWSGEARAWHVQDAGSLNGTRLNGRIISNTIRRPGRLHRLASDDILLLGSRTAIKVVYLPNTGAAPDPPQQHLPRLAAPPSRLQPTTTLRSEALAQLRSEVATDQAIAAPALRLTGAVLCRVGVEHARNGTACEDVPFWGEPGRSQAALYCVFDGHCGRKTAAACTRLLPEELRKRLPGARPALDAGAGVSAALWEEVFLATDAALETEDGATATAVLVWRDAAGRVCLQAANVGDSAAVFCRAGEDPRSGSRKLTADHRISDPAEQARLAGLGIELGKNRTRLYGLNLSRCLGDSFIKGADLGFTAVPAVSPVAALGPGEAGLLVVASDGLWDVAEPGRVMELAFEAQRERGAGPEGIADAIYQHAMKQRSRDDVCVIVLCFSPEDGAAPPAAAAGSAANGGPAQPQQQQPQQQQ